MSQWIDILRIHVWESQDWLINAPEELGMHIKLNWFYGNALKKLSLQKTFLNIL